MTVMYYIFGVVFITMPILCFDNFKANIANGGWGAVISIITVLIELLFGFFFILRARKGRRSKIMVKVNENPEIIQDNGVKMLEEIKVYDLGLSRVGLERQRAYSYKIEGICKDTEKQTVEVKEIFLCDNIDIDLDKYVYANNITALPIEFDLDGGAHIANAKQLRENSLKYSISSKTNYEIFAKAFQNYNGFLVLLTCIFAGLFLKNRGLGIRIFSPLSFLIFYYAIIILETIRCIRLRNKERGV